MGGQQSRNGSHDVVLGADLLHAGMLVAVAGALISITLMLFNTVRDIIHVIGQAQESLLVESQDAPEG